MKPKLIKSNNNNYYVTKLTTVDLVAFSEKISSNDKGQGEYKCNASNYNISYSQESIVSS